MAEHEHPFDILCKKTARVISRRSILGAASVAFAGWLSPWSRNQAFAQEPEKKTEKAGKTEFHKYFESSDWKCNSLKQVKLLQDSNGKTKSALDVCVYNVQCVKVNGANERPIKVLVACKLTGDFCLDLPDCATAQIDYDSRDIQWTDALFPVDPKSSSANVSRFGQNCTYDTPKNAAKVLFRRILDDPEYADPICASPVKNCATSSWLAICDPIGSQKVDGKTRIICPMAPDCLAKPIESIPALTESESASVSPNRNLPSKP